MTLIKENSVAQLRIIEDVASIADMAHIPLALRGGWALDFLLGKITRLHGDIDFNVWIEDLDKITSTLQSVGYECEGVTAEPLRNFHKYGETIQVAALQKISDTVVSPAGYPEYSLLPGLMHGPIVILEGVRCRTATAEAQLDAKEKKLFWDPGETYSDKALADMKLLRHYLSQKKESL